jgi:DNA phosphorothioation-dependent restriction protein DptG
MLDIRPIVVNADMVILGGNMRFKACKEAGLKEVPIIIADNLTEEQQREFLIKDNVSGGEWDWSLLNDWDTEQLEDWGLEVPVFKDASEPKDLSDELKETFEVIISCVDETQQQQVYNKLIGEGLECRVLTL